MQPQELDQGKIERLLKQEGLLARAFRADYAADPDSQATKTSRSNLIAVQHTARQMYGDAVSQDLAEQALSL